MHRVYTIKRVKSEKWVYFLFTWSGKQLVKYNTLVLFTWSGKQLVKYNTLEYDFSYSKVFRS